ncbi:uridine kinase [Psychrobacillus lasiicapitis]|uniref:Uridine kinase n=2 Tax=Psychrobacillus lasiicapitis TaxID=1636719 RepID=A0A544T4S8_9BACI|nr:uridine kinase [Psychrobacillus lasiicapitis]GGA38198.1 uridine kinase [Psychrobacillus lasiicapitis]
MHITNKIMERMKHLKELNRTYIIGIDGLSGAGKTTITEIIAEELTTKGQKVVVIHIDDLIEERGNRYNTGHPEWYEYYSLQWDVHGIKEKLFEAVHERLNHLHLKFYDKENDLCYMKSINIEQCTVILLEGIFLQRKEWSGFFDYIVYLDCPKKIRSERVLQRDEYLGNMNNRLKKYERRYWRGEEYYLQEVNPIESSDIVITSF